MALKSEEEEGTGEVAWLREGKKMVLKKKDFLGRTTNNNNNNNSGNQRYSKRASRT